DRQPYDVKAQLVTAPVYEAYWEGRIAWQEMAAALRSRPNASRIQMATQRRLLGVAGAQYRAIAREVAQRRTSEPEWFQVRDELDRITSILETETGCPSQWNRQIEITSYPAAPGAKSFHCLIRIRQDIASSESRWATLLQEVLHALSE